MSQKESPTCLENLKDPFPSTHTSWRHDSKLALTSMGRYWTWVSESVQAVSQGKLAGLSSPSAESGMRVSMFWGYCEDGMGKGCSAQETGPTNACSSVFAVSIIWGL
jgi:hypothetical protein